MSITLKQCNVLDDNDDDDDDYNDQREYKKGAVLESCALTLSRQQLILTQPYGHSMCECEYTFACIRIEIHRERERMSEQMTEQEKEEKSRTRKKNTKPHGIGFNKDIERKKHTERSSVNKNAETKVCC